MRDSFNIQISAAFWIFLAMMILLLPLSWIVALLLSSFVHELCHLAAMKIMRVSASGVRLGMDGAYLETPPITPIQGAVCALAGPLGALSLLLFARWMPRTALCAAVQSCYHLLPILPLDGGRALRSLIAYFGWNSHICTLVETVVMAALALLGLYLMLVIRVGILPCVLLFAIIFRICREKFLANGGRTGYNRCTN